MVRGNFDDCLRISRELAEHYPVALVNSVNPFRLEGQKTASFEIVDFLGDAPDVHVLPVGNAGNISAYWKGYVEYAEAGLSTRRPQMLGWQADGAAPLVLGEPVAATRRRSPRPSGSATRRRGTSRWTRPSSRAAVRRGQRRGDPARPARAGRHARASSSSRARRRASPACSRTCRGGVDFRGQRVVVHRDRPRAQGHRHRALDVHRPRRHGRRGRRRRGRRSRRACLRSGRAARASSPVTRRGRVPATQRQPRARASTPSGWRWRSTTRSTARCVDELRGRRRSRSTGRVPTTVPRDERHLVAPLAGARLRGAGQSRPPAAAALPQRRPARPGSRARPRPRSSPGWGSRAPSSPTATAPGHDHDAARRSPPRSRATPTTWPRRSSAASRSPTRRAGSTPRSGSRSLRGLEFVVLVPAGPVATEVARGLLPPRCRTPTRRATPAAPRCSSRLLDRRRRPRPAAASPPRTGCTRPTAARRCRQTAELIAGPAPPGYGGRDLRRRTLGARDRPTRPTWPR